MENVFSSDKDESEANQVEVKFLHYSCGYWDFPKTGDDMKPKVIDAEFVFMGPCTPAETKSNGYKFAEDQKAVQVYNAMKRKLNRT